jgi:hypothetical protein
MAIVSAAHLFQPAAWAGFLDDADKLEGKYIVKVGKIEQLSCPIGGKYNCLTWPSSLYKLDFNDCYEVHGLYSYSEDILLAVDSRKQVSLFVLSSGLGGKIKQHRITGYDCPDTF